MMENLYGDHIIDQYTRGDMINDGSLIDVTKAATELGFTIPVALTSAVWIGTIQPIDGETPFHPNTRGALWRCLIMLRTVISLNKSEVQEITFSVPFSGKDDCIREIQLKACLGVNDQYEPVITIMEPEEE